MNEDDTEEQSFDASDPEQVQERRTKRGRIDRRLREVLQGLLSLQDGREWLWHILADTNVFTRKVILGDPHETAFEAGQREVGLRLMRQIAKADPASFTLMLQEHDKV